MKLDYSPAQLKNPNKIVLGWNNDHTYYLIVDIDIRDTSPSIDQKRFTVYSDISAVTPYPELNGNEVDVTQESSSATLHFSTSAGAENTAYSIHGDSSIYLAYLSHEYTGGRGTRVQNQNCYIVYDITTEDGHWEGRVDLTEFYYYGGMNHGLVSTWKVNGKSTDLSAVQFGDTIALQYDPVENHPHFWYTFSIDVTPSSGSTAQSILALAIPPDQTSLSIQIPLSAITMMANTATQGTVTFKLQAMRGEPINNSTVLSAFPYATQTKTAAISIPSSVVPTISSVAISEGFAGLPAALAGHYIQRKSMLAVEISAVGIYGATITQYNTEVGGASYSGAAFTSNVLTGSGQIVVKTTVTDSRGRKTTLSRTITVVAYSPPTLREPTIYRCAGADDITVDIDGAYGCVIPNGSVSPINNLNTCTLTVFYKKTTAGEYSHFTIATQDYTFDTEHGIFAADVGSSYDIYISLTDIFGEAAIYYCTPLPATGALIELGKDRKSLGIFQRIPTGEHGVFIAGDVFLTGMQHEIAALQSHAPGSDFHDQAPSQFTANDVGGNKYLAIANYHIGDTHITLCIDTGNLQFGVFKYDTSTGIGTFTGI